MTDDKYFGFNLVDLSIVGIRTPRYVPIDFNDPNLELTPTNWAYSSSAGPGSGTNIEHLWTQVQAESDERVFAVAEMWKRASDLLQNTREHLQRHAEALAAKWRSPAGDYFMRHVGAALYSLDEWKGVADDHASGLNQIGEAIQTSQRDFRPLWEEYLASRASEEKKREEDECIQFSDLFGRNNAKSPEEVQQEYHGRAVAVVKPLTTVLLDVTVHGVHQGSVYQGPMVQSTINPVALAPTAPSAPAPPGFPASAQGGSPPARPTVPTVSTPSGNAPAPPALPDGVTLAGGVAAPPAPPPTPAAAYRVDAFLP